MGFFDNFLGGSKTTQETINSSPNFGDFNVTIGGGEIYTTTTQKQQNKQSPYMKQSDLTDLKLPTIPPNSAASLSNLLQPPQQTQQKPTNFQTPILNNDNNQNNLNYFIIGFFGIVGFFIMRKF
jgi:hypothetical protein